MTGVIAQGTSSPQGTSLSGAIPSRRTKEHSGLGRGAIRTLSVLVVLAIWQLVGRGLPYAISYPTAIVRAAIDTTTSTVIPAFGDTMAGFGIGFAICIAVGVPIGLLMARVKLVQLVLDPYNTVLYSTPFVALFPLLILFFGISFNLRLSVVLLTGIFPIIINTYIGAARVDRSLLEIGAAFNGRRLQVLRTVVIPGSLHYIFAGIRIGFGRGLMGMIIIEIEASAAGVGNLLSTDAQELRIDRAFVPLIYLGVFSILCNALIRLLERWATMPWSRTGPVWRWVADRRAARQRRWRNEVAALVLAPGQAPVARLARRLARRRPSRTRAPVDAALSGSFGRGFLYTKTGKWVIRAVTLAVVLVAWQLYARGQSTAVLPVPTAVAGALYRQIFVSGAIWGAFGSSIELLVIAFAVSVAIGVPVGIAMGRSRLVEYVVDPYVAFLYALPHVAFIPIMVVWLGLGPSFAIAFAVFSSVFIVIINTMTGVKAVDPELLATARSFCASERQALRSVVLPSAVPYIVTGARLGFSATWIGVIVAQIITTETGFGGMITNYSNSFQMPDMFVPVIAIMAISVVILTLTSWLEPRLTPWAQPARRAVGRADSKAAGLTGGTAANQ